jgi:hypothetical protein
MKRSADRTIVPLAIGETKSLTLDGSAGRPGEYALTIPTEARAGILRSICSETVTVRLKVWPEESHSQLQVKKATARACTMEGFLFLGRNGERLWRGSATLPDHPRIHFTDASFHEYPLDRDVWVSQTTSSGMNGAAWHARGLPVFAKIGFSVDFSSDSDLSASEWAGIASETKIEFATLIP